MTPDKSQSSDKKTGIFSVREQLAHFTDRLSKNRYNTDEGHGHIAIDQERARATGAGIILENICPAHVYKVQENGDIHIEDAACLECGTCLAVAPAGVLTWHYPRGGKGIVYRHG